MSKGKKVLKVIGIIFGCLVGLIIVVHIILNIIFSIQLHNKITELKAQGRPMTIAEIVPAPVQDEENAAIQYSEAFVLMKSKEGSNVDKLKKITDKLKSYSDISEWTDEQRQEIPELINSRELQDIYSLLEEGSRKPKCRFNRDYEKGPVIPLTELEPIRRAVRFLCIKALLEAESGKTAQAFDTLLVGLKVSNHLKDELILISQLVRIACDRTIIECIESIADSKGITSEQANLIMNELSAHESIEPFIKCMDGERVLCGGWAFEGILKGKMPLLYVLQGEYGNGYNLPLGPRIFSTLILPIYKPILKKDFACYLTVISKMQDSYNIPYYERARDKTTEEDVPKYCILTSIVTPALNRIRELQTTYQANIDICRTGLVLKLYKAKNGNYPEELESLVSAGLLKEVPIDPFSGKSLVYSRYIDGFKLYSLGPNMQDDFGTPKAKKDNEPAYKDYDIVWKSES